MKASVVIMAHGVKGYATRCPVIDTAEVHSYFQVFHYWEQGQYPNSGTWADQPNRLVESMEIIRGLTKNANTA